MEQKHALVVDDEGLEEQVGSESDPSTRRKAAYAPSLFDEQDNFYTAATRLLCANIEEVPIVATALVPKTFWELSVP